MQIEIEYLTIAITIEKEYDLLREAKTEYFFSLTLSLYKRQYR